MLNKQQIKLVQAAVRGAGLRSKQFDGRYRLLLAQYKQPDGTPVTSCKQLNGYQLTDLLSICESHGWKCPGKDTDHFRRKAAENSNTASFAQQRAVEHLAGDLGWNEYDLAGMLKRMSSGKAESIVELTPRQANNTIEALKNILSRQAGKKYNNLSEVRDDLGKEARDGQKTETSQIG